MVIKLEAFMPIGVTSKLDSEVTTPNPRVYMIEMSDTYGRFVLEPLERGYATTIGNPIRRVLLNSIPGLSVTWIRVENMVQEYSSMPHLKEDMMELLQRVKQIRLKPITERREGRMRLVVNGPGEMADADYGYVGTGKEQISLYKGHELIKRNINADDSINELIQLIKSNNDWIDPE